LTKHRVLSLSRSQLIYSCINVSYKDCDYLTFCSVLEIQVIKSLRSFDIRRVLIYDRRSFHWKCLFSLSVCLNCISM